MVEKKVSVVVPVYNVEKYLGACILSLINQSYCNLEIILIDDESSDKCPMICDNLANQDNRIRVIHKKNGGAASARNAGLNYATGEYICFVDSDDLVDENYISTLVYVMEHESVDIAICSYYYLYRDKKEKKGYNGPKQIMSQREYLLRFLEDWTCSLIWNKMFKKEVIGKIRFAEGHKIDDEFFTYQIIMNATRVAIFDKPLYEYRMRASSVMQSSDQYEQIILKDRLQYLVERYENVSTAYPDLKQNYLGDLVNNFIVLWRKGKQYTDFRNLLSAEISKYIKIILLSKLKIKNKYAFVKAIYFDKNNPETHVVTKNSKNLFD